MARSYRRDSSGRFSGGRGGNAKSKMKVGRDLSRLAVGAGPRGTVPATAKGRAADKGGASLRTLAGSKSKPVAKPAVAAVMGPKNKPAVMKVKRKASGKRPIIRK